HFRKTSYSDAEVTTLIATTSGVRASYRESFCGAMTSAVATQNGERQIGYHGEGARRMADLDADAIGKRAAQRALEKLGAKPFPTQKLPVVLDPWMAMSLLGAISPLFSADSVLKGRSLFAGKVVERGVLRGYLTNVKTARKMSSPPTGNARRGSYASPSRIGPSNFYIEAGND